MTDQSTHTLTSQAITGDARQCTVTVLDSGDDAKMTFDENGACNYVREYHERIKAELKDEAWRKSWFTAKVQEIKDAGKGKKYDCIMGLSGGTDSSYMAVWANENGLRPLVVHLDNGWNSELAVKNIENICSHFNYDLHTHVIDWEEFKALQIAYLRASVVDIEVLTDHAIQTVVLDLAAKHHINYSLSGFNLATEAVMPRGWTYDKTDLNNLKDIVKQYGGITKFKTFPTMRFLKRLYYHFFLKLESIHVLDFIDYNKEKAMEILKETVGWRDYGGKHYESAFTKFYQAYILPEKFGIDKRKAHLSNLILSGQMTKEQALEQLQEPLYGAHDLEDEKEYILKKFGFSVEEFDKIMQQPRRNHEEFDTDQRYWKIYFKLIGWRKPFSRRSK